MVDVSPNFKAEPVDCPCGCGRVGRLRVRPWRDGSYCVRNCKGCNHCRGLRSKKGGARSQSRAATALGIPRSALRPGHEEHMGGAIRFEHKGGARDAGPIFTRYDDHRAQSERNRSIGDNRPFVATYGQGKRTLIVFDLEDGPQVLAGLAENWGMAP